MLGARASVKVESTSGKPAGHPHTWPQIADSASLASGNWSKVVRSPGAI
jgi:hypothetical protein